MTRIPRYQHPKLTEQGRPASLGDLPEIYTARLAFSVEPLGKVREVDLLPTGGVHHFQVGDRGASIERYDLFYALRVDGFPSHEQASQYLKRACLGMLRLSVTRETAIEFSEPISSLDTTPENLEFRESFAEQNCSSWNRKGAFTDAAIFSDWSCVIPEHLRIWEFRRPFGKEVRLLDVANIAGAILEAQEIEGADRVLSDARLRLAISTFGSTQNTWNREARFVGLVTVLEVLKRDGRRPQFTQEVIDKLDQTIESYPRDDEEEAKQLEQLKNDIGEKRYLSITNSIRKLVYDARAANVKQPVSREASDRLVGRLYGIRSTLVHEGKVPTKGKKDHRQQVAEAYEDLRPVVSRVLGFEVTKTLGD